MENINQELIFKIREAGRYLHPRPGDKNRQKEVLVLLSQTGPMSQRELTRQLRITPPSASELVRKLEFADLIVRRPNPQDRRNINIELTDLGQKVATEYANESGDREEELFSVLSPEEKEELLYLLDQLIGYWETIMEPEPVPPKEPKGPKHRPPHEGGPKGFRPPHGFGPGAFPFPFGRPEVSNPDDEPPRPPEPGDFDPERMNEIFENFRRLFGGGFPGWPPRPEDMGAEGPMDPEEPVEPQEPEEDFGPGPQDEPPEDE